MNFSDFEPLFEKQIALTATKDDPAHDLNHFKRVVKTAKNLCASENAKIEVVLPAAWLHDFVIVPKNDPRRKMASKLSAEGAIVFLRSLGYPAEYFNAIAHAIEAHSFSANIRPETLEAKVVQDADRLDALGAIGLARCLITAGLMKRPLYEETDPFCTSRNPDDSIYTIDHFYTKLFKVAETLQTAAAQREGQRRLSLMKDYLKNLSLEI